MNPTGVKPAPTESEDDVMHSVMLPNGMVSIPRPLSECAGLPGMTPEVMALLKKASIDIRAQREVGKTELHVACKKGDVSEVKRLIDLGLDVNASMACGKTPMTLAIHQGSIDCVKLLLDNGASILPNPKDCGWTPMHHAAREGRVDMIQLFVERGTDINVRCVDRETSLSRACMYSFSEGKIACARYLLGNGAIVDPIGHYNRTPLLHASGTGSLEIATILLDAGANINAMDKDGCTPLDNARKGGHLSLVRLLLSRGAVAGEQREEKECVVM